MFNSKLIATTLGIASLTFTSAAMAGPTVGNPSQSNNQGAGTAQCGNQSAGGTGVVVGPTTQVGVNANSNTQGNVQAIGSGPGSTTVGNPSQDNNQAADTSQCMNQGAGGSGTHIGPTTQVGVNANSNKQGNIQAIGAGPGSTTVGNPSQHNHQGAHTNQQVNQAAGGSGVVIGPIAQLQANLNATAQGNIQIIF